MAGKTRYTEGHTKEREDAGVKKKKSSSTAIRKQEELWHEDTRDWTPRGEKLIIRVS